MMDDGKVTITIEIDAELLAQVSEVLKSYGLTGFGSLLRTQGARRVEIQIFPADGFRHVRRNRRTHPAVRICP